MKLNVAITVARELFAAYGRAYVVRTHEGYDVRLGSKWAVPAGALCRIGEWGKVISMLKGSNPKKGENE